MSIGAKFVLIVCFFREFDLIAISVCRLLTNANYEAGIANLTKNETTSILGTLGADYADPNRGTGLQTGK